MNEVLKKHGWPTYPESSYRFFVGEGSAKLIEKALPKNQLAQKEAILAEYLEAYGQNWNRASHPYDGILRMLADLRNEYTLCVLSNKPDAFTRQCVSHYFEVDLFNIVRGQLDGCPRKPDPQGLNEIFEKLGKSPSQCIMIGDTKYDTLCAKHAGIPSVGVTWGFRPREELETNYATTIIDHPSQLQPALALL